MRRSIILAVVLAALVPAAHVAADEPTVWSAPLALGPTDATSIAARGGLVIAGGRAPERTGFNGEPEPIPGPRTPGLFRSTDQGRTWTLAAEPVVGEDGEVELRPITQTPDLVGASRVAVDAYAVFGTSVWRSDDDGETFRPVGALPSAATAFDVLLDGRPVAGLAAGGLAASGDLGATWASLGTGLPAARVNQIAQPSPDVLLVATDQGVYRSADGGATFARSETGLLTPSAQALAVTTRTVEDGDVSVGVDTAVFLAMPGTTLTSTAMYVSNDLGVTWGPITPVYGQNLLPRVQPGALAVAEVDPDPTFGRQIQALYAGTSAGLYISWLRTGTTTPITITVSGVGVDWVRLDPEPGARAVTALAVADRDLGEDRADSVLAAVRRASPYRAELLGPDSGFTAPGWYDQLEGGRVCGGLLVHGPSGDLIAACGRHVFRSPDEGATWRSASAGLPYISAGIADTPYSPLAQSADGSLWTSGFHYGLYRSNPETTSWSKVAFPAASAGQIAGHPTDPDIVYAAGLTTNGCCSNVLWRTVDGGLTWTSVLDTGAGVASISVGPLAPDRVVVAASNGSWLSQDAGATWTRIAAPSGAGVFPSAADADVWWASGIAGEQRMLHRSDDAGATWQTIGPIPFGGFHPSPWDVDTIYLSTVSDGILVTRDGGVTWGGMSSGIAGSYVSKLFADRSAPGTLWAAAGVLGAGADPPHLWVQRGTDPEVG